MLSYNGMKSIQHPKYLQTGVALGLHRLLESVHVSLTQYQDAWQHALRVTNCQNSCGAVGMRYHRTENTTSLWFRHQQVNLIDHAYKHEDVPRASSHMQGLFRRTAPKTTLGLPLRSVTFSARPSRVMMIPSWLSGFWSK